MSTERTNRERKARAIAAILWRARDEHDALVQVLCRTETMTDAQWLAADACHTAAAGLKRAPSVPSTETKRLVLRYLAQLTEAQRDALDVPTTEYDWVDQLAVAS
jgi:hypothetical protein